MNNYLYDENFLKQVMKHHTKTTYARITALTWDELPTERIEGQITGGTVNIDGSSALRRTCSLSMVSNNININNYYWGLQNKFKLEVGLENIIDSNYPEIIWFPQGLFIITSFNTSVNVNNCTISIQGKDKMCLLNGDIGGSLPSQIDFGVEEYYNIDDGVTTYNSIPLKTIIKNAVNVYGNEPLHNIIINDLDMLGFEQLKYQGETPLYLVREESIGDNKGIYTNMTINGKMNCQIKIDGKTQTVTLDSLPAYNKDLPDLGEDIKGTYVTFPNLPDDKKNTQYTVFKAEYGDEVGYRPTELVYAGELIANAGEALTSILDKIKNMLGNFEYFYDLEGHFVFQQKKTYIKAPWSSLQQSASEPNDVYAEAAVYTSSSVYNFNDLGYFTALTHNPTFNNLKNDFSIWGTRKGITGIDIPIHLRYVLEKKPVYYKNYNGDIYITNENYFEILPNGNIQTTKPNGAKSVDWREIIYQMAYDYYNHHDEEDFLTKIIDNNKDDSFNRYPSGFTGYETYYVDLYSFWRDIYDPRVVQPDFVDNQKIYYELNNDGLYVEQENVFILPNEEKKYPDAYELKGGEYLSAEDSQGYSLNPTVLKNEDRLGNYYQCIEYEAIGLRSKEQYDKQKKKFLTETDSSNKIKLQYYLYENGRYVACFDQNNSKDWISNKNYYKKLDETIFVPYNFYEWKIGVDTSDLYYANNSNCDINTGKSFQITKSPELLDFWIDFIGENSLLEKHLACNIGNRTKAVNDSDVTAIYFQKVPDILYITAQDFNLIYNASQNSGYTQIRINDALSNSFSISTQGKSAYDVLTGLLEENTYCVENITITSIPIYYLDVNTRIEIYDKDSSIEGEYLISKITLPLAYNGTMSITATKAMDTIY